MFKFRAYSNWIWFHNTLWGSEIVKNNYNYRSLLCYDLRTSNERQLTIRDHSWSSNFFFYYLSLFSVPLYASMTPRWYSCLTIDSAHDLLAVCLFEAVSRPVTLRPNWLTYIVSSQAKLLQKYSYYFNILRILSSIVMALSVQKQPT